jgi:hypothetical protein
MTRSTCPSSVRRAPENFLRTTESDSRLSGPSPPHHTAAPVHGRPQTSSGIATPPQLQSCIRTSETTHASLSGRNAPGSGTLFSGPYQVLSRRAATPCARQSRRRDDRHDQDGVLSEAITTLNPRPFFNIPFYLQSTQEHSANCVMGKEGYDHIRRHVEDCSLALFHI